MNVYLTKKITGPETTTVQYQFSTVPVQGQYIIQYTIQIEAPQKWAKNEIGLCQFSQVVTCCILENLSGPDRVFAQNPSL